MDQSTLDHNLDTSLILGTRLTNGDTTLTLAFGLVDVKFLPECLPIDGPMADAFCPDSTMVANLLNPRALIRLSIGRIFIIKVLLMF